MPALLVLGLLPVLEISAEFPNGATDSSSRAIQVVSHGLAMTYKGKAIHALPRSVATALSVSLLFLLRVIQTSAY